MSFFSKISELFYDLFVTEPEEEEYIDSAGEDGKEAGPRMAGALPARGCPSVGCCHLRSPCL